MQTQKTESMESSRRSPLHWSFSLHTHFESCRRHYFYHRFWDQDPKLKWQIREMRNITTLTMLRGLVVHDIIKDCLNAVRDHKEISIDEQMERVTTIMRQKMRESYYQMWRLGNRPQESKQSDFTNLLEHYYNFPDTESRARESRDIAQACIRNLLESDFWHQITKTNCETWRTTDDRIVQFELEGIRTYVKLDFAHAHGQPTIIDWKTGKQTNQDQLQLTLYSLYAQQAWGWDPKQTRLVAAYLYPDFEILELTPEQMHIDETTKLVKESFLKMLELEPAEGELADITRFPITDDVRNCRWCRFQGICEGAHRLKGSIDSPYGIVEDGSECCPE